jgi:hypothetical protein
MPNSNFKRYSVSAEMTLSPSGVLHVLMSGPLTGDGIEAIKAEVVTRYGPQIRGFVVDYRRSLVALTGAELDALLAGALKRGPPQMPGAMIVRSEDADLFCAHALRVAQLGIMRRVFLTEAPAWAWAEAQAERQTARLDRHRQTGA